MLRKRRLASKHCPKQRGTEKNKQKFGLSTETPEKPCLRTKDKIAIDELKQSLKPSLDMIRTARRKINSLQSKITLYRPLANCSFTLSAIQ